MFYKIVMNKVQMAWNKPQDKSEISITLIQGLVQNCTKPLGLKFSYKSFTGTKHRLRTRMSNRNAQIYVKMLAYVYKPIHLNSKLLVFQLR